ncbi:MAG: HD domain-containing protein, partial [Myxococcota bacterium]
VAAAQLAGVDGAEIPTIDVAKAAAMRDELASISTAERVERYGLKPDRADVIVPALYVITAMATIAGLDRIACPGVGLKEGIVRELVDKHYRVWDYGRERDQLFAAALQLGRRYHFDERHATLVSAFACDLFDGTQALHGLAPEDRGLLRLAALLHDIGDFVHPSSHHKHTQYIIENSDFMGLPPEHRKLVALVARYHRRATPALRHAAYASLDSVDRDRVKSLASLLRIADALDRGHRSKVDDIRVSLSDRALTIEIEAAEDVSLETWTLERKAALFRDVFGLEVRAVVPRATAAQVEA